MKFNTWFDFLPWMIVIAGVLFVVSSLTDMNEFLWVGVGFMVLPFIICSIMFIISLWRTQHSSFPSQVDNKSDDTVNKDG